MICPDCGVELSKPRTHSTRFTASYYCNKCRAEHIVWEDIMQDGYAVQSRDWRICCDVENKKAYLRQLYMDIESDTSICYRWATVLGFPVIPPNLNENTIVDKIKFYLLFS